jgi:hypothetical protein
MLQSTNGGLRMKKLLLVALATFGVSAYAATLTKEVEQDMKKICIYSDGSTITMSTMRMCPMTK